LIREVKKGQISPYLKDMKPGDRIDIVGPYGEFWIENPQNIQREYLFIATGVGLGPFLSYIRSYPHLSFKVIHGIRYGEERVMARGLDPERYITCISKEKVGDYHGRVTEFFKEYDIPPTTYCYICGNPYMLRQVYEILLKKGLPHRHIFTEAYYAY